VLAPEHALVAAITSPDRKDAVEKYIEHARTLGEIERMRTERERTGAFTGAYAINPLSGEAVPVYIADYVLAGYGTGAIMAVPGHDSRDFDFAKGAGLEIRQVIAPEGTSKGSGAPLEAAFEDDGVMVNSDEYSGLPNREGFQKIASRLEEIGAGKRKINFRLRDWLISRQRFWGAPIPIVYCEKDGAQAVPDEQLPVLLPTDAEFKPDGVSPLTRHEGFLNTTCPKCGGPARRETDTLDTFVDSSWYFLRYLSPKHDGAPWDKENGKEWMPVHQYTGGIEHACMHLLYARFFVKACADLGIVPAHVREPFTRLFNQGMILGEDGEKMSKSRGNVIDPDALVDSIGADAVRLFLVFIGPWEAGGPWNSRGVEGVTRFLQRVWTVCNDGERKGGAPLDEASATALRRAVHKTIKSVTNDYDRFAFNTIVAKLMELTNALMKHCAGARSDVYLEAQQTLVSLLAPLAPHITEELWQHLGGDGTVHDAPWPKFDPALAQDESFQLVVQVNGKVKDKLDAQVGIDEAGAKALAFASDKVKAALEGKEIKKAIYVPGRLFNIVVG